jgi:tRNA pseudouridine65 synthase
VGDGAQRPRIEDGVDRGTVVGATVGEAPDAGEGAGRGGAPAARGSGLRHVDGPPGADSGGQVCPDPSLEVLYADEDLVAINKPAGLLVHRTPLDFGVRTSALQQLRDQLQARVYPAHRLDRATSGVLLFALDAVAHERLSTAFEYGGVAKRYLAIVRGWPADTLTIDYPLRRLSDDGEALAGETAQQAVTALRTLARVELPVPIDRYPAARYALVELRPATGRRHQLRRHLKHANHPIVGDTTYGKGTHNRLFRERFASSRMLLHASRLEFSQPTSGQPVTIEAPLQPDFATVVAALGFADRLTEGAP